MYPPARNSCCQVGTVAYRKKMEREIERVLMKRIEERLPANFRRKAPPNAAGPRSVGLSGRTVHNVLEDTIQYITLLRKAARETMTVSPRAEAPDSPPSHRDAMISAHSILSIELDVDDSALCQWKIRAGRVVPRTAARLQCVRVA